MMNNIIQIVVIIPTLNEEYFIADCLKSVIHQSYPLSMMDIMVVDGGSSDKTAFIVNEFSLKYNEIRFVNNPKKIQSAAFNIGVSKSLASYIIRLDAHAVYDEKYIELCLMHLLKDSQIGNAGGKWLIKAQYDTIIAKANAILNSTTFGIGGASYRVGDKEKNVETVPFGAFPRKVVEEIGPMNESLARGEDNEYNARIRKAGYRIHFDPNIKCIYFARKNLKESCLQMFANGKSVARLLFLDKNYVNVRHLVPLCFVISLFVNALLYNIPLFRYVFLFEVSIYILLDILVSLYLAIKKGLLFFIPLLFLFPSVHISYGIGTIWGFLKK